MRSRSSLTGLVVLVCVAACSAGSGDEPTTTRAEPPSSTATTEAPDSARLWADRGVDDYTLSMSISNMNGMGGGDYDAVYTFEVRDGEVTDCVVTEMGPNAALAEGICDTVSSPVGFLFSWTERFDPRHTTVEYDSDTHVPLSISYDDPETADEEYLIRLIRLDETES